MKTFKLLINNLIFLLLLSLTVSAQGILPEVSLTEGWQLQDIAKVKDAGIKISGLNYITKGWYKATVPGTILTSLVNNKVYLEPLYGENNRPDKISEYLCRTSYWYRTRFSISPGFAGKRIWLNFNGINYAAEVWVNRKKVGNIKGAFARGVFDITDFVIPGKDAALAVLINPQPNPGIAHEHTIATGMGKNGLYTSIDGPTFLCSIGWDWIPAIRDRNTGIWQKVSLTATNLIKIKDPFVVSNLNLPDTTEATITAQATVENQSGQYQKGTMKGSFSGVSFQRVFELAPHSSKIIIFDAGSFDQLKVKNPRLWWPNGYGAQNLYRIKLTVEQNNVESDQWEFNFGIRKITYSVKGSENLTISVNGYPVICKGGNWGMDEAMKRIPRDRLEAQIRMHQLANYTMIRNWVGQSTSEDFYELCDKYGLMLWDEFFQPNPSDGPNPTDINLYLYNVKEKILRFRNHPAIAVWCARNEGFPPTEIDDSLKAMMVKLDPSRLYQASSTDGRGVHSGGPYFWRQPKDFYDIKESFKTETGTMSIPTIESIQGMMPRKDWEEINDDWAEHDFADGAQKGTLYPKIISDRFGKIKNLADFVRKSQMANYESYRAMYEGRFAKLFNPVTGVITWMSHPAQPSFVWQLYHYDLEPNAALFAVRKACEPIHVQLNEKDGNIEVINSRSADLKQSKVKVKICNLDGKLVYQITYPVYASRNQSTDLPMLQFSDSISSIYLVKLELFDSTGKLLSDNLYWKGKSSQTDNLQQLDQLTAASLDLKVKQQIVNGKCFLDVIIQNNTAIPALMAHLQLRKEKSQLRVLPVFYSDNYFSLLPGESKQVIIEASLKDLDGENPMIMVDGWNIAVKERSTAEAVKVKLNENAQVSFWPVTGLPFSPFHPEGK